MELAEIQTSAESCHAPSSPAHRPAPRPATLCCLKRIGPRRALRSARYFQRVNLCCSFASSALIVVITTPITMMPAMMRV